MHTHYNLYACVCIYIHTSTNAVLYGLLRDSGICLGEFVHGVLELSSRSILQGRNKVA